MRTRNVGKETTEYTTKIVTNKHTGGLRRTKRGIDAQAVEREEGVTARRAIIRDPTKYFNARTFVDVSSLF